MDIFDKIANSFKKTGSTQPLRLRRDYGEEIVKEAKMTKAEWADKMENDPEFAKKWNGNSKKSSEGDVFDRIASEFISDKEAHGKGPKGQKSFKKHHDSDSEFAEIWDGQIEANKDRFTKKKALDESERESSNFGYVDPKTNAARQKRRREEFEKLSPIEKKKMEKAIQRYHDSPVYGKKASDEDVFDRIASEFIEDFRIASDDDEIIDDIGLDRFASEEDDIIDDIGLGRMASDDDDDDDDDDDSEKVAVKHISQSHARAISKGLKKSLRGQGAKKRQKKTNKTRKKPMSSGAKAQRRQRKKYKSHV